MSDPVDAIRRYLAAAAGPTEEAVHAAAAGLAPDVVVAGTVGAASGREAVLAALAALPQPTLVAGAEWSEPQLDTDTASVEGRLPAGKPFAAMSFRFRLDGSGLIARVEQRAIPHPPPAPAPLALTEEIREAVNGALANGTPVVLAYVDAQGAPHLSFRGSTQVYGVDQLAIWVRDPEGGLLRAIGANPQVGLLYRDPKTRRSYQFAGRARAERDPSVAERVYAGAPELERNLDAQRRGAPVIVDLDRVEGIGAGGRFRMER